VNVQDIDLNLLRVFDAVLHERGVTPAAVRLENVARFMDFVGESISRAAEQAREILFTRAPTDPPPDRG